MSEHVFTVVFPFGGSAGGAKGFQEARVRMFDQEGRFQVLGGIDFDQAACHDFEYLTGVKQHCADIVNVTPADLRAWFGARGPDCVFFSPPCKGASGLLSTAKSKTPKYAAMNELALRWVEKMLQAWPASLPGLVLLENVPRLKTRAAGMLRKIRALLRGAGYVLTDGFHDCGELGGLAQRRRRYLLVARLPARVPPLLYQPPKLRVRGCGEVLGELPMPGDPSAGPMHALPKLSWLNWVRLALIPAGGDWRDLDGVLRDGQAKREVFKRHGVLDWTEPSDTIGGSGSNGPVGVADPRLSFGEHPGRHENNFRVTDWDTPAGTVVSATRPGSGAASVADPRIPGADVLRVERAYDNGYGVLRWGEPSPTVAGGSNVGQGAYSVADLRFKGEYYRGTYGVMSWQEAAGTITGNARHDTGRFVVADPRKPPPFTPVIIAADGTWHRPLTTLELAVLQGMPATVNGKPLVLHGNHTSHWRERIGNMVPRPAARAIGVRMLVAFLQAKLGAFALDSGNAVWVERAELS